MDPSPLKEFLLQFNRFSPDDLELVLQNTSVETFRKGDLVLEEGRISKKCYLVIRGSLRQFKLVDGTEKNSAFFFEEDPVVSYSSYLNNLPSEYSIQCLEDCVLISGTKEQELEMRRVNPQLEFLTHDLLASDFKKAEHYISLLNNFSPEERYLQLLKTEPKIINRVSLVYIASYLGITPESLSRIRKRIGTK